MIKLNKNLEKAKEITIIVPDDIIEALNRQKTRLGLYKIVLDPYYGE